VESHRWLVIIIADSTGAARKIQTLQILLKGAA
jgi:hypothetical protein